MPEIQVHFFATLRAQLGEKKITLEVPPGSTVQDVKDQLSERYPEVEPALQAMLASVNREFSDPDRPVPEGAELAFFPHIAGGLLRDVARGRSPAGEDQA